MTLVFTDEAGRPLPGHRVNSALSRIAGAAGVGHVHPHKLRHSAASLMLAEGMDIAAVGAVLGHASPAVNLSGYSHALNARKRSDRRHCLRRWGVVTPTRTRGECKRPQTAIRALTTCYTPVVHC